MLDSTRQDVGSVLETLSEAGALLSTLDLELPPGLPNFAACADDVKQAFQFASLQVSACPEFMTQSYVEKCLEIKL